MTEERKHGAIVVHIPPGQPANSERWVHEANACAAEHCGILVGPPSIHRDMMFGHRALRWAMTPAHIDTQLSGDISE